MVIIYYRYLWKLSQFMVAMELYPHNNFPMGNSICRRLFFIIMAIINFVRGIDLASCYDFFPDWILELF
jgi:hypothetical protein